MFEKIAFNEEVYAIIIHNNFSQKGIRFFTPDSYPQQLAYMNHEKGKIITPHIHNHFERIIEKTSEVLFIKRGKLRVDFYNNNRELIDNKTLSAGDVILLISGGHGFEVIEDVEMFEVKQGPYIGDNDKVKF
jgi:hypothetical protein